MKSDYTHICIIRDCSTSMTGIAKAMDEELQTFIEDQKEFFLQNHRLSMAPRMLERQSPATREHHRRLAEAILRNGPFNGGTAELPTSV